MGTDLMRLDLGKERWIMRPKSYLKARCLTRVSKRWRAPELPQFRLDMFDSIHEALRRPIKEVLHEARSR